ncbi:MAG: tetratricopeptide repeat protein [Armatimonadetes bacterium]|nr:tetratricopeptide repeat protein [Akkermansiaceae bacterium]
MQDRVATLQEAGDPNEALHAATAMIDKCQQMLGPDLDTIDAFATALELRTQILLKLGRNEESAEDAKQAIDQLDNRPDRLAQMGRLHAVLGAAYDAQARPDKATESWRKAVEYFEKHDPPLSLDVASMVNNLGFLAKANGDLDTAEDHFLKALEIMHANLGQKHEETAAVSNNLGAVYLAAGYLEQAREMHMMALETRRELFGESHPDTAQSHNNLALALLETGDRAWARRHFEKALASFESLGVAYADDLEAVASNYCDFLKAEGEENLSQVIAGRVRELLETN